MELFWLTHLFTSRLNLVSQVTIAQSLRDTKAQSPRDTIAQSPRDTQAQTLRVTKDQTPRVPIAQTHSVTIASISQRYNSADSKIQTPVLLE